jgi:NAD(P)-dependent dehydrogenase (short-subunit alcohol dehydrogenase family)
MAARLLIDQGHDVVLHGRNEGRSRDALAAAAGARGVVSGDLSTIAGPRTVADEVNKLGRFDAVIHNRYVINAYFHALAVAPDATDLVYFPFLGKFSYLLYGAPR